MDSGDNRQSIEDWLDVWPRMFSIDHIATPMSINRRNFDPVTTDTPVMTLDHAKLDVYHRALDLLDQVDRIYEAMPPGRAHFKDQLDRAATSIVLNIAEGAGEFSRDEKQRFYRIARRSATETAAILDILQRRHAVTVDMLEPARDLVVRVVSMLVRLASA
jgi:four helix bundle protein